MMPPMARLPCAAFLGLLFASSSLVPLAQAGPILADVASIPGTVSIGRVGLPDKKQGARELSHAVGKDVESVVRDEVKVALQALRAFTQVVPEGGDYILELDILAVRREDPDPALSDDRKPLALTLDGRWTWKDASGALRTGEGTVEVQRLPGELTQREDLELVARKAFDELGDRAFADLYASRN